MQKILLTEGWCILIFAQEQGGGTWTSAGWLDGAWNTSPWQLAQPASFKAKGQASPPDLNPAPLPLATMFYAGHQGPKCAQHALSRRSNGKGVGEGGTSTPRWGAPTLHARTQRTKLSFPVHRQMTTSNEYSGLYLQAYRMLMVLKKPH